MLQWDHLIFPLILKQNYMLTEISKRMCGLFNQKKIPPTNTNQKNNITFSFFPPFLSNQIRDWARSSKIIHWLRSDQHCKSINQGHPCYKGEEVCHMSVLGLDCSCQQTGTPSSWQVQENQLRTFQAASPYPSDLGKQHILNYLPVLNYQPSLHNMKIKICFPSQLFLPCIVCQTRNKSFVTGICLTQKQGSWVP